MTEQGKELAAPSLLGLRAAFGFGDRIGLATPGHAAACRKGRFLPLFAQQSVRELERTARTPGEVMRAAQEGAAEAGWTGPFGADADHLKTRDDVESMALAGFTFFTIDPSEHVDDRADRLRGPDLEEAAAKAARDGGFDSLAEAESLYLNRSYDLLEGENLAFRSRETLLRAVTKYGRAVAWSQRMARWIGIAAPPQGAEIEISVDETAVPTTPLEHLFIGLELKRRGVVIQSLAPRFVGEFEKGIDYKGDLATFESSLARHVAVARFCGPYKIGVHSGSDKFSIYPILGRLCGDLLHVKTAGTSYLEALRVAARRAADLFAAVAEFSCSRFETDRATYQISARLDRLPPPRTLSPVEREKTYLDSDDGRQVLHVTFGSVLTRGRTAAGRSFKEALREVLLQNADLHEELLARHLGRHIELLGAG